MSRLFARAGRRPALLITMALWLWEPAAAQSHRPLTTESADTLEWGKGQVEIGVSTFRLRPPLRGDDGRLWNLPELGASVGLGPTAELQVEGAGVMFFDADERDSATEPGDWTFWTKVRFWRGTPFQPVVAGRLGVKLPVATNETGLATDSTDFFAHVILSQRVSGARFHLNLGVAVLGLPTRASAQVDALTYGLALEAPLPGRPTLVGEVAGQRGSGTLFDRSFVRVGVRWEAAGVRWDAALTAGLIDQSEDWGVTTGVVLPFSWKPTEGIPSP